MLVHFYAILFHLTPCHFTGLFCLFPFFIRLVIFVCYGGGDGVNVRWVPEILLATTEPSASLDVRGKGTIVEARVCRTRVRLNHFSVAFCGVVLFLPAQFSPYLTQLSDAPFIYINLFVFLSRLLLDSELRFRTPFRFRHNFTLQTI